ncbi:MAG: 2-amino-4-hydroxy-6-hydroxymethyldihydropteridine diphosphokinase, partial [Rikenellaceae bacterium]|nr:2-amino-4-hydroxy-6-hydroxymethyldihydropteridine diphosphokinase [Rikenellaceae bacterium]
TQAIEQALGRGPKVSGGGPGADGERVYRSRTMDIDLLFYDDLVLESERLTLPHPLLAEREFVLTPLREVCGGWMHPVIGRKLSEL